jgi:hypothetical protein
MLYWLPATSPRQKYFQSINQSLFEISIIMAPFKKIARNILENPEMPSLT